MASITFKAFPASLHRALKSRAERHKRSLNREVLAILDAAVRPARELDVDALVAEARRFRDSIRLTVTSQEIDRFKREGRG